MVKKILLIEDELDLAAVAKVRIECSGYEVTTMETAEDALVWLQKNTPDLILLDLLLPKMHGDEFCMLLKADDKFKKLPIVLFTASASNVPKVAKEVGADDYIMKPYEPEELLEKVKKFIGNPKQVDRETVSEG